ncbi:MAG: hypothetical protein LBP75_11430 [Planctomycetota bacterium]|jgi:hypothetical protein|nr:hypothetical protein [Planctomycetota bacterium]
MLIRHALFFGSIAFCAVACGEKSSAPVRPAASPAYQSPASRSTAQRRDAQVVVSKDTAILSSELTKGDVIRSGQYPTEVPATVLPAPTAPQQTPPVYRPAPPPVSPVNRGSDYDFVDTDEPVIDYRQVAVLPAPTIPAVAAIGEKDCADNSCQIADGGRATSGRATSNSVKDAEKQSGALKNLLNQISGKKMASAANAATEEFAEQQLLAGDPGNFNAVELEATAATSAKNSRPAPRRFARNLWPGGVPVQAEIDPEIAPAVATK